MLDGAELGAENLVDRFKIGFEAASENAKISSKEQIEGAKIGKDIAETLLDKEDK